MKITFLLKLFCSKEAPSKSIQLGYTRNLTDSSKVDKKKFFFF